MPGRKIRARCIAFDPGYLCFKPCGRPGRDLATVELEPDELEALRLSDFEGLYQEECARCMGISRTTLSRTLAQARRKVADTLLHGKRLVVALTGEATETGGGQTLSLVHDATPQPTTANQVQKGKRSRRQEPKT